MKRTRFESKSHLHIAVRHLHRRFANRGLRRHFTELFCRCLPQREDVCLQAQGQLPVELLSIRPQLSEASLKIEEGSSAMAEIETDLIQI